MTGFLLLFAALAAGAIAAPINCAPGSLAAYIALPLDGCRIGSTVFSNFLNGGVQPGSTEIDPSAVQIAPVSGLAGSGLRFTYNVDAGPFEVLESAVEFTVMESAKSIGGASLRMGEFLAFFPSLTLVTSELCYGDLFFGFCTGPTEVLAVFDDGLSPGNNFQALRINPVKSFGVRHDAVVDAGLDPLGAASLDFAELRFQQIPEPGTAITVLAALAALTFAKRCRTRRTQHDF